MTIDNGVVDSGTFDISATTTGASITTLSGAGAVTLGARTLTLTAGSSTFSGAIGGTGGLTLSGGTETLSGANSFTGATTINAGATLALTGSGSIATSSGVADSGTFDISATTAGALDHDVVGCGRGDAGRADADADGGIGTFSGAIGGTGGLTLSGPRHRDAVGHQQLHGGDDDRCGRHAGAHRLGQHRRQFGRRHRQQRDSGSQQPQFYQLFTGDKFYWWHGHGDC